MIILPGDLEFDWILATVKPPGWQEVAAQGNDWCAFIADSETGILRPATYAQTIEYCEGGEYDERLKAIGEFDAHGL